MAGKKNTNVSDETKNSEETNVKNKKNKKTLKENKTEKDKKVNLHKDHRKRVRARFIREGSLDSFEYHQILELLLFYAIPMKDTNELAHELLLKYGSFHNLLNANPEDIMLRGGVTENTAVLISLIPHLARKYLNSKWDKNVKVDSIDLAVDYFRSLLVGKPYESFYMLCLDAGKRLNKAVKISDGTLNQSHIYIGRIVESAIVHKSVFVIIGHNHPSGTLKPSNADFAATEKIISALKTINVKVIDHVIVCEGKYFSFAERSLYNLRY